MHLETTGGRMILFMLRQISVVAERLVTYLAEVYAGLLMHERHVLAKVRRCFADVIALPATERLRVHVDSVWMDNMNKLKSV